MRKALLLWNFWLALSLLWGVGSAYLAYKEIAPFQIRKKVTVVIAGQGQVAVVFSNAQPHNEVIYEMKTQWEPLIERSSSTLLGQTFTTPYDTYLADRRNNALLRYGAIGACPLLMLLVLRVHSRRRS